MVHSRSRPFGLVSAYLVSVQRDHDGQAALPVVPPALQEPLLGLHLLLLPLHAPLALPQSLQILLVLQQMPLQSFPLAAQPLGLQEALLLPLLQLALLLTLEAHPKQHNGGVRVTK